MSESRAVQRRILHVDMDAFFASVEQRDRPELRGQPVVVGGTPERRGVVSAASYEAREFGIRSAMPSATARRLCPDAVFLPVDGAKYRAASREVMRILHTYTPLVEPISCDEAFLDATGTERLFGPAEAIGREIKRRVRQELDLVASVGVAPNKFLAKLASDLGKPDGFVVVQAGEAQEFLGELPVRRLWGVGPATEERLRKLGIGTIGALARFPQDVLQTHLGDYAAELMQLARGEDDRPVEPDHEAKSISSETTFAEDTSDVAFLRRTLLGLAEHVGERTRAARLKGRTVNLKIRFEDFTTRTRHATLDRPTASGLATFQSAWKLVGRLGTALRPVRLIGVGLSNFDLGAQLDLFDEEDERHERVEATMDDLRRRFGRHSVRRASLQGPPEPSDNAP